MKTVFRPIQKSTINGFLVRTNISLTKSISLGHDRVDRLSEKQLNLLNNALYRLKASKSVFDITLEEIVGQYELVTEHISPRSLEIAVENYQKRQKMN